jgi:hypothetical protein
MPDINGNLTKNDRMEKFYYIIDKNLQKIIFNKNRAQADFDKNKHTRNVILKSRQLGFTTYEAIDSLDDTLFTRGFSSLFIAHTKEDAIEIFDKKVELAWKNFDKDVISLGWGVDASTANKLKFDFGDGNYSQMIVSNSGRSGTHNRVHISEFAKLCAKYPAKADEIITGTIPSVPAEGRIDIESTAEGMGGHFYDIFWEAWTRKREPLATEFKAHFYNWQWDDEDIAKIERIIPTSQMEEGEKFKNYQIAHKLSDREITYYYTKWLSLKKDWDKLHQEYPTTPDEAFISSGSPYFDNEKIKTYLTKCVEPMHIGEIRLVDNKPVFEECDGNLSIWEKPQTYSSYVIGGDTAEGLEGGDYQVLEVIDNKTLKCVAKYKSHVPPDELAKVAFALGKWYNWAYLGIESNKDGLWVNSELFKMAYPNLYYREEMDDIAHTMKRKLGFRTDQRSRDNILVELKSCLNTISDCWTNADFLRECMTFVRASNGKPEAMTGRHDDEIMATAIAFQIRVNAPREFKMPVEVPQTNLEITRQRLERMYGKKDSQTIKQSDYT